MLLIYVYIYIVITAELKTEFCRARTLCVNLERELSAEHNRMLMLQRCLKHEQLERRKMQDKLEGTPLGVTSSTMSPTPPNTSIDHDLCLPTRANTSGSSYHEVLGTGPRTVPDGLQSIRRMYQFRYHGLINLLSTHEIVT